MERCTDNKEFQSTKCKYKVCFCLTVDVCVCVCVTTHPLVKKETNFIGLFMNSGPV